MRLALEIERLEKIIFTHPWNLEQIHGHLGNSMAHDLLIMENKDQKGEYEFSAISNGPIIGYCLGLAYSPVCEAEILRFAVHPSFQREQLGTRLLLAWEKNLRLKSAAPSNIFLEVSENNQIAIAFYKKLEYQDLDRRKKYYHDGSDAIIMKKIICR